jgi:putative NADH-flavin reductase
MKIDTQTYNDIVELLGVIVNDSEEDSREVYTGGCGGDYVDVDTYIIDQEDFDMEKAEALYEKLKNLRQDRIAEVEKEIENNG